VSEELNLLREELSREKAKFAAILSSMAEGLIAYSSDFKVVVINQAGSILLRQAEGDVVGMDVHDVLVLYAGSKKIDRIESPMTKSLEHGLILIKVADDYYARNAAGWMVPVTLSAATLPRKSDPGQIQGVLIFRDATVDKQIDRAKTEFVSIASHQLRTPLSTVSWYAEMLLSGDAGEVSPQQKVYLEEIYNGNKRMVELVGALLNVSRLELGTFMIEPKMVNISGILRDVAAEQEPQVRARGLLVSITGEQTLEASVDPQLTRIVFQNLLSNAIKYTPEGGTIVMELSRDKEKGRFTFRITDTGWGIPKNQHERVFSKLFRADNVMEQDTEGTGLGLYIVKMITEQSGGSIHFESAENKGTTFYLEFPLSGMNRKEGIVQLTPLPTRR